jgi:fumarate reductase subunit C
VSVWWWLERWSYTKFVLRELTSVFVAGTSLLMLWQVRALAAGPDAWNRALDRLASPAAVAVVLLGLVALVYHSVTWFALAPRAMVVRVAERRLPDALVSGLNYAAWAAVSAVVAAVVWSVR